MTGWLLEQVSTRPGRFLLLGMALSALVSRLLAVVVWDETCVDLPGIGDDVDTSLPWWVA